MFSFSRIDRHAQLVTTMADRNGADIATAMQTGELTAENFRSAVYSCTGCSDPEACEAFLDTGGAGVPEYCRNASMFARLSHA